MRLSLLAGVFFLTGCASLMTGWDSKPIQDKPQEVKKEIQPGMNKEEIRSMYGDPESIQIFDKLTVWKYTKWKPFVGNEPYYAVFDENNKLYAFFKDEAEYRRNQAAWAEAFRNTNPPQPQKQEIDVTIHKDIFSR